MRSNKVGWITTAVAVAGIVGLVAYASQSGRSDNSPPVNSSSAFAGSELATPAADGSCPEGQTRGYRYGATEPVCVPFDGPDPFKGRCLADGLSTATIADLGARSRSSPDAEGYPVEVNPEEARSLLAFVSQFPRAPAGWTASSRILDRSAPNGPAFAQACTLETRLLPAGSNDAYSHGARVFVNKASDDERESIADLKSGDGVSVEVVDVNGFDARLVLRAYEPEIFHMIWWDGGEQISVVCAQISVDQCTEIARSVE